MPLDITFKPSYQPIFLTILHLLSFVLFYRTFSGSLLWIFMVANAFSWVISLWADWHNRVQRIGISPNRTVCLYCPQPEEVILHSAYVSRCGVLAVWQGQNRRYHHTIFPWTCSHDDFRRLRVILAHELTNQSVV